MACEESLMDTPVARSTTFKIVGPQGGDFFWQPVPANGFIRNILSQATTGADANFSIGTQTVAPRCFVREHTHAREEEIRCARGSRDLRGRAAAGPRGGRCARGSRRRPPSAGRAPV